VNQFSEEDIYLAASEELKTAPRPGLIAKCMAVCEGDEKRAQAMYLRERVNEIKNEVGFIRAETEKIQKQAVRVNLTEARQRLEYQEAQINEINVRVVEIDEQIGVLSEALNEAKEGNSGATCGIIAVIGFICYFLFEVQIKANLNKLFPGVLFLGYIAYHIINSFYKGSKKTINELETAISDLIDEKNHLLEG
jgi:hypothetical protein